MLSSGESGGPGERGGATSVARQHQASSKWSTLNQKPLKIRLHNEMLLPIPRAPYLLQLGAASYHGRADEDGWLVRNTCQLDESCVVHWSSPRKSEPDPALAEEFEHHMRIYLRIDDDDREQAVSRRLHNLGFVHDPGNEDSLAAALEAFQIAYEERGLEPTGTADEPTLSVVREVHDVLARENDVETGLRVEAWDAEPEAGEGSALA